MTALEDPTADNAPRATLRIIPLGGLGEIGMNLMVYEYGDAAIIGDCGMMFPDSSTLGGDVIVPDMEYPFERPGRGMQSMPGRAVWRRSGSRTRSSPLWDWPFARIWGL